MNGRRAAARRSSASGTTQSALTGRCGPCCSVEPTAITTGVSAAVAAAISGQVIHSYSTVPAPTAGLIRSSLTATHRYLPFSPPNRYCIGLQFSESRQLILRRDDQHIFD